MTRLAEELSAKAIMGTDGTELGTLHNVTVNIQTGKLDALLVEPREGVSPDRLPFEFDDAGQFRVPADRVEAVRDYVVVRN